MRYQKLAPATSTSGDRELPEIANCASSMFRFHGCSPEVVVGGSEQRCIQTSEGSNYFKGVLVFDDPHA